MNVRKMDKHTRFEDLEWFEEIELVNDWLNENEREI